MVFQVYVQIHSKYRMICLGASELSNELLVGKRSIQWDGARTKPARLEHSSTKCHGNYSCLRWGSVHWKCGPPYRILCRQRDRGQRWQLRQDSRDCQESMC